MNWSELLAGYEWAIPVLIVVALAATGMAAVGLLARRRGAGFSVPRHPGRPYLRWGETLLWLLATAFLLTSYRWRFADALANPYSVPEVFSGVQQRLLYLGAALSVVVVAAALRSHLVAGLTLVGLAIATSVVSARPVHEWPEVARAVQNSPVPFSIVTPPGLPPVSVSINDVPIGTTPVATTWEDLKTRTPTWPRDRNYHNEADRGTLFWGAIHVHQSGLPSSGMERDEKDLYFRYALDDKPLYVCSPETFRWTGFTRTNFTGMGWTNMGVRVFAEIQPFRFEPTVTLAEWGDEALLLLHRARLADYVVDDAWCVAFGSYGPLAESALEGLKADDPALQSIVDTLARRRYPWLTAPRSEAEAWSRLLSFIDEAGSKGGIDLHGIEGAAVRQIARQISDDPFARLTAAALGENISHPGTSVSTQGQANDIGGIRITPRIESRDGRWLRAPLLQQLAVERDAALDAESPEPDNPIEVHVVPVLMRRSRVGDGLDRQIGGHAYEQALFRHNWRDISPGPFRWDDIDHIFGATVNHWLVCLAELDSDFGREFRRQNPHECLALARTIFSSEPFMNGIPQGLDFVFVDHRSDLPADAHAQTLARTFLREFLHRPADDKRTELRNRWTYLARMAPDSQPTEYVAALNDVQPDWFNGNAADFLKLMPAENAVAVLQAILDDLERQYNAGKYPPQPRHYDGDRRILIGAAYSIDHPAVGALVVKESTRGKKSSTIGCLEPSLREGHVAMVILEKLAAAEDPALRKLIAETGLHRTAPHARRLIEQLATDKDDSVRAAALEILRQWKEWSGRPLPTRTLPAGQASPQ